MASISSQQHFHLPNNRYTRDTPSSRELLLPHSFNHHCPIHEIFNVDNVRLSLILYLFNHIPTAADSMAKGDRMEGLLFLIFAGGRRRGLLFPSFRRKKERHLFLLHFCRWNMERPPPSPFCRRTRMKCFPPCPPFCRRKKEEFFILLVEGRRRSLFFVILFLDGKERDQFPLLAKRRRRSLPLLHTERSNRTRKRRRE